MSGNEKMIYGRITPKKHNFSNPPVNKKTEKVGQTDAMGNCAMAKIIALVEKSAENLEEFMRYC